MKRFTISLLMLTACCGCPANKPSSYEDRVKAEPDAEAEVLRESIIVDVENATGITLSSEDATVDAEPVTIDDDHLLTIKAPRNGYAAFSPDGERIVASYFDKQRNGYSLKTWDSETGELITTFRTAERSKSMSIPPQPKIAYGSDGKRIVSILTNEPMKLWDAEAGQHLFELKGHESSCNGVCFSPDGQQVLSGSYYNKVLVWDATSGKLLRTVLGPSFDGGKYVLKTAFSADAKQIATGYQSFSTTVVIWSLPAIATEPSASPIKVPVEKSLVLKGNTGVVSDICFSPDGARVVVADYMHFPQGIFGDEVILAKIWDCKTGKTIADLEGHTDGISSVAFSPGGKQVVSGGLDKTVRLWNAESGLLIKTLRGHTDTVRSVSFSPDGNRLLSSSKDGTLMLWKAKTTQ